MTRRKSPARIRRWRSRRRGLASLETVMTTAFTLPFMVFALLFAVQGTRYVWKITVQMLGWPFM
jgi:hypothetical protein